MLKLTKLTLALVCLLAIAQTAEAKLKIPYGDQDKVTKVLDLPDTEEYKEGSGYLDLYRMHTEYIIAWCPLSVSKEPKLVLVDPKNETTYYDIEDAKLNEIITTNKLDKAKALELGAWTKFGGKLVFGAIILAILYSLFSKFIKKDNEETVETKTA
jgi:hypothetical protein